MEEVSVSTLCLFLFFLLISMDMLRAIVLLTSEDDKEKLPTISMLISVCYYRVIIQLMPNGTNVKWLAETFQSEPRS